MQTPITKPVSKGILKPHVILPVQQKMPHQYKGKEKAEEKLIKAIDSATKQSTNEEEGGLNEDNSCIEGSLSTPQITKTDRRGFGKENEGSYSLSQGATESKRKSERIANKPKTDLSMQEQAAQSLMKKCGILNPKKVADEANHHRFRTQLLDPLQDSAVDGFRDAFGLNDP